VPSFAIGFEATAEPASRGIKAQAEDWRDQFDRHHVPNIQWNDVGYEEVNIVGGVRQVFITSARL